MGSLKAQFTLVWTFLKIINFKLLTEKWPSDSESFCRPKVFSVLFINKFFQPLEEISIMKIAVVGTGYVGLSNAVLLAQKYQVKAVDIISEKVDKINNKISPIVDAEIEKFLATESLDLEATTNLEYAV